MSGFRAKDQDDPVFFMADVTGQVCDVAPSVHDPEVDLLMPQVLPLQLWLNGLSDAALEDVICKQVRDGFTHSAGLNRGRPGAARQRASARVFGGTGPGPCDDFKDVIARSARLYKRLRERLLRAKVRAAVDTSVPWFRVRDRGPLTTCVGSTAADLIERQRALSADPPSARFLAQASRELDGDGRPTTMFAAPGTSLRGVLAVARDRGHARESELPSINQRPILGKLGEFSDNALQRKAELVVNLGGGRWEESGCQPALAPTTSGGKPRGAGDVKNLMGWLLLGRPVAVVMQVGPRFFDVTAQAPQLAAEDPETPTFSHPLLVVGFRLDERVPDGIVTWQDYLLDRVNQGKDDRGLEIEYIVRNSANPGWGINGYARVRQQVLLDQTREAYGLLFPEDEECSL